MSCVPARALFHTAPRCVEIRELPAPRPAAGEVLVRTVCSGISGGTERLVYRGEVPADLALDETIDALGGAFTYPFAYGYACAGEGAGHAGPRGNPADRVVVRHQASGAAARRRLPPAAPDHPQHSGFHGA